jgi:hypothetical protein
MPHISTKEQIMFNPLSRHHSVPTVALVLASVGLLMAAATADAGVIYVMTDSQPDGLIGGGIDAVQAQFVVSGGLVTSAGFSITTPDGTLYSEPVAGITVPPTGPYPLAVVGSYLELMDPGTLVLQSGPVYRNGILVPSGYMNLGWRNDSGNGNYYMGTTQLIPPQYQTPYFYNSGSSVPRDPGNGNWIIATAIPEPATLLLLVSGLLGLACAGAVRRR